MKGETSKKARLKDFAEREVYTPAEVSRGDDGIAFIPINPFADDDRLLEELGMRGEECIKVDGYIKAGGDVGFLQVLTTIAAEGRLPGNYVRLNEASPHYLNVMVVLGPDVVCVTRAMFEEAAAVLSKIIREGLSFELSSNLREFDI